MNWPIPPSTMQRWNIDRPLAMAVSALIVSICFNLATTWKMQHLTSIDDSRFSYIGDDFPVELPLKIDTVALTIEDTTHYSTAGHKAWSEWKSLDKFPKGNGFVQLGSNGRYFGLSMFHQMHCLNIIRQSIIGTGDYPDGHTQHCLNLIRQAILCASDTTLDAMDVVVNGTPIATDGLGMTHVCRDWTQVYDYVTENQNNWPPGV